MGGRHRGAAIDWSGLERLDSEGARAHLTRHAGRFATPHPGIGLEVDPEVFAYDGARLLPPGRYRDLVIPDARGAVFVVGDLVVDGVLEQPNGASPVLVEGDLRCDHLVTTAYLVVTGGVEVAGVFYGNCTNYDTAVYGDFHADAIIREKNHHFAVFGATRCNVELDDEEHGYEVTAAWMRERGLARHDARGLAAVLRAP